MWYSNVLIELFQNEFSFSQRQVFPVTSFCLKNFGLGKLQLF
jgi:hypothetical protein